VIVLGDAAREARPHAGLVKDGRDVCAVGACRPDQREMETALVRERGVFVDSRVERSPKRATRDPDQEGAIDETHIAGSPATSSAGADPAGMTREITTSSRWGWRGRRRGRAPGVRRRLGARPWKRVLSFSLLAAFGQRYHLVLISGAFDRLAPDVQAKSSWRASALSAARGERTVRRGATAAPRTPARRAR